MCKFSTSVFTCQLWKWWLTFPQYWYCIPTCLFWQFMRDRAQEEGQHETYAFLVYLGSVEAGVSSLVTCVQELQHKTYIVWCFRINFLWVSETCYSLLYCCKLNSRAIPFHKHVENANFLWVFFLLNCCLFLSTSAVQQAQDVDQLRGKVAIEATKDAWNHAASATHLFIWPVGVAAVNWASWLKLFYLL